MKSPLYLLDKYVYPALRRQLVLNLYRRGLNITEISRLLGISKSLVSRYLKGERGNLINVEKYHKVLEEINRIAEDLLNNSLTKYELEARLIRLAIYMMKNRYICFYHGKIDPEIDPSKCNICDRVFNT